MNRDPAARTGCPEPCPAWPWVSPRTGHLTPNFVAVQTSEKQQWKTRRWTHTECTKLLYKLLLRKIHFKVETDREESKYSINHSKALIQSSGLSNDLLSELRQYETGINTFFSVCCNKKNNLYLKMNQIFLIKLDVAETEMVPFAWRRIALQIGSSALFSLSVPMRYHLMDSAEPVVL